MYSGKSALSIRAEKTDAFVYTCTCTHIYFTYCKPKYEESNNLKKKKMEKRGSTETRIYFCREDEDFTTSAFLQ